MSIGERRHRVVFQSPTVTQNAMGEPVETFATLCTSWAMVRPISGTEQLRANEVQGTVNTRIVTRARSELDNLAPGDRATWDGRTYDIRSVIYRDHRRHEIEILADEHL